MALRSGYTRPLYAVRELAAGQHFLGVPQEEKREVLVDPLLLSCWVSFVIYHLVSQKDFAVGYLMPQKKGFAIGNLASPGRDFAVGYLMSQKKGSAIGYLVSQRKDVGYLAFQRKDSAIGYLVSQKKDSAVGRVAPKDWESSNRERSKAARGFPE